MVCNFNHILEQACLSLIEIPYFTAHLHPGDPLSQSQDELSLYKKCHRQHCNAIVGYLSGVFACLGSLLLCSLRPNCDLCILFQAEEDGFNSFHVYVCASVLVQWSIKVRPEMWFFNGNPLPVQLLGGSSRCLLSSA